jgi:UDP-3-O-[3-hydroxymyristoyl] glucosamine N-acyltransferase
MKKYLLSELAKHVGGDIYIEGKKIPDVEMLPSSVKNFFVEKVMPLEQAESNHLSFLTNPKYASFLPATRAGAVIVPMEAMPHVPSVAVVVSDPHFASAKVLHLFAIPVSLDPGIHSSAVIHPSATIHPTAAIGAHVVVGEGAFIAEGVKILSGTVVGEQVRIGARSLLYPNVTLYRGVSMGEDCILHSGAVIGSDGFGFAKESNGNWLKVPQLGGVRLGNRVEIGANTTVDRGALLDTELHDDVKLDNLVHIGHNVIVKENTAMAAHVGVSGSVKIGKNCILAGKVGVAGHLELADGVILTGATNASKSISKPGIYSSGIPAKPQKEWARIVAQMTRLDKLHEKFLALQKSIQKS